MGLPSGTGNKTEATITLEELNAERQNTDNLKTALENLRQTKGVQTIKLWNTGSSYHSGSNLHTIQDLRSTSSAHPNSGSTTLGDLWNNNQLGTWTGVNTEGATDREIVNDIINIIGTMTGVSSMEDQRLQNQANNNNPTNTGLEEAASTNASDGQGQNSLGTTGSGLQQTSGNVQTMDPINVISGSQNSLSDLLGSDFVQNYLGNYLSNQQSVQHQGDKADQLLKDDIKRLNTLFPNTSQWERLGAGGMNNSGAGSAVSAAEQHRMAMQLKQQDGRNMAQVAKINKSSSIESAVINAGWRKRIDDFISDDNLQGAMDWMLGKFGIGNDSKK
jgi:hypothetical protein